MSAEELHKRIEQLSNHNNQLSRDIYEGNRTIRPTSLGQDRFHRAYWVLPRAGGIYVESLESGVGADERYDQRRASHAERLRRREAELAGDTGKKRSAESPAARDSKRSRVTETPADEQSPAPASEPAETREQEQRLPNGDAATENGLSGGESPRLNGDTAPAAEHDSPVKMETDVKPEVPAKSEPAPVKLERLEPLESVEGEPMKADSPAAVKSEPVTEEGAAVKAEPPAAVKPEPAPAEQPSVQDSLSAIKQLVENPVAAAAATPSRPAAASAASHGPPPLNSKHLVSYLNASLASLGASGALKEVNGAIQIPGLGLVPSQYLLQALQAPEKLWFSVLPKEPCDFSTITELSDDEQESVTERGGGARTGTGEQAATEQEDNGEDEAREVPEGELAPLTGPDGVWREGTVYYRNGAKL